MYLCKRVHDDYDIIRGCAMFILCYNVQCLYIQDSSVWLYDMKCMFHSPCLRNVAHHVDVPPAFVTMIPCRQVARVPTRTLTRASGVATSVCHKAGPSAHS